MSKLCLMMVAGERSGDLYGGELAQALRARLPELEIFGCGGEAMRRAGVETLVDAHALSMAGITEVASKLPRAWRALARLTSEAGRRRPRLAVLIDFPDFNLRLAKRLKSRGVPVVYFVSPQVWAWRRGRLRQLKDRIEKMLCLFDFEEKIYRDAGIAVEWVGHPLVDLVRPQKSRAEFFSGAGLDPAATTVALLPGSRPKEVAYNLPPMLEAAGRVAALRRAQFVLPVAPSLDAKWVEATLRKHAARAHPEGTTSARIVTAERATYDALAWSDLAVVASGTATVEAALLERPMVVVYRVSALSWALGKFLVNVPFYSMVNILAGKRVVPELMQGDFTPWALAAHIERLTGNADARETMARELGALKTRLGPPGAIGRAADAVARALEPAGATFQHA